MSASERALRVHAIVATLFSARQESVTDATSPADLEKWDSMGHLSLVLELEQEFGVALAPECVERMRDVGSVVRELEGALG
ncbi:MAG: acyl carrier protein [Acidobacteriota bacterium]